MDSYGASVSGSPALIAMTGPPIAVDTLPGIVMNNVALTALLAMALVAMLTVVRHTRGEEEEGRSEVLRATVVGRHAGSAAAMLLDAALSVVMGIGCALAVLGSQVPASASWLFGASVDCAGDGVRRSRAGGGSGLHPRPCRVRDLAGRARGRLRDPGHRRRAGVLAGLAVTDRLVAGACTRWATSAGGRCWSRWPLWARSVASRSPWRTGATSAPAWSRTAAARPPRRRAVRSGGAGVPAAARQRDRLGRRHVLVRGVDGLAVAGDRRHGPRQPDPGEVPRGRRAPRR